jgi:hypothetical protein
VVRALGNQRNETLELIPSSKLRGDLPPALVDGHVHWLNLSAKIIEIRPLERLWEQSSEHWRIDCASGQYRMYKGRETLVDIRSATWAMASKCFECLNNVFLPEQSRSQIESKNLLVTTSPVNPVPSTSVPRLSVALPHYGLSFFVNETEDLESHDFKDMVYDENQCVGALFGLKNLLVLRQRTHIAGIPIPEALIPRRVLIPNGYPTMYGNHLVRLHVNRSSLTESDEPLYHTYNVDDELGCLTGNGSLTSIRLLAYLHAMTSCYLPDSLTGKTGVQAALCLLQSAGCRSVMKLKALDDNRLWTSTQYPQINAAYQEILNRYYWNRDMQDLDAVTVLGKHAPQRAACLFPLNTSGQAPLEDRNYDESNHLTAYVPPGRTRNTHTSTLRYTFNERTTPRHIKLDQLFSNRPAPQLPPPSTLLHDSHKTSSDGILELDQLLSSLRTDSSFQREYLACLDASAQCIRMESQMTHGVAGENLIEVLRKHYVQCRVNYLDSLNILKKSLGPTADLHEQALDRFGQWPPITADVLLRYLASTSPVDIPLRWKKCLISLALLLLELQRSRRLFRFALDGLKDEFSKELENTGCDGWNPEEYPDWLLIQVSFFCLSARLY